MITEEIVQIISTVGFPIVLCLFYVFDMKKVIKSNTEVLYLIKDKLKK